MKWILGAGLVLGLLGSAWAAAPVVPPPPPATQAEVNAGVATRPYVSPATLAGLGGLYATSGITGNQWTQYFNANIVAGVLSNVSAGAITASNAVLATTAITATNALGLVTNAVVVVGGSNLVTITTTALEAPTNVPSLSEIVVTGAGTGISGRYRFSLGDANFQVWTNTASTNLITYGDPLVTGDSSGPWVLTPVTNTLNFWYDEFGSPLSSNNLAIHTWAQIFGPNPSALVGWTTNTVTNWNGRITLGQNNTLSVPGGIVGLLSTNAYVRANFGSDSGGWHPGIDRPYATVSGALSNAPAGATVIVEAGRFTEVGNIIFSSPVALNGTNGLSLLSGISIIGAGRGLTHIDVPIIVLRAGGLLKDFSTTATVFMSDAPGSRVESVDGLLRPGKADGVVVYGGWGSNTVANCTFQSVYRGLEIEDAADFSLGDETAAATNGVFDVINTWFFVEFTNNNAGKYYSGTGTFPVGSVSNYTRGIDFEQYGRGRLRMLGGGIIVSGPVTNNNILMGVTNSWIDLYNVALRFPRDIKTHAVAYQDFSLGVGKGPITNSVTIYGGTLDATQSIGGVVTVDNP